MAHRLSIVASFVVAVALMAGVGLWIAPGADPGAVVSAQDQQTWNSTMIWAPTLEEAGLSLAEFVNEIDANCSVDVDPVSATNGDGPEGPVYAFAVTWSC